MERLQPRKIEQSYECEVGGQVFGTWRMRCQLSIYFPHLEQQTVIVSQAQFEAGLFIPYRAEDLATQVVRQFGLNPAIVTWIEHYSDLCPRPTIADFNLVIFGWKDKQAFFPVWQPISYETAELLAGESLQFLRTPARIAGSKW